VSFVNAELARTWSDVGVKPAEPATDEQWCERLFVNVLGRRPKADEELKPFVADSSSDKRQRLVERLLSDTGYVQEYARHWSAVWSTMLLGRASAAANRQGLQQYLERSLAENKPFTQIVRELLTATGSAIAEAEDYNPALHFLADGLDRDATVATSRVARVFLGHHLHCAQCHNHPSQNWSQEDFWALNSFFRQMRAERTPEGIRLTNVDFLGQGRGSRDGEVFYETPTGLLKTAFPRFIDGTKIAASGELAKVDRRGELARLVAQSDGLPKSLVNRVWSEFFGYGFARSVDDIGSPSSPAHGQLLDRLAREFEAHDYDLRSLIRWVVLSDPFARSTDSPELASKDIPEVGDTPLFSRYYRRPAHAGAVYNALTNAARIRGTVANNADAQKARVDWLAQLNRSKGTPSKDAGKLLSGLAPSPIIKSGNAPQIPLASRQEGLPQSISASEMKFEEKVKHLFLMALARQPNRRELEATATILAAAKGDDKAKEAAALEDIWWAIVNSNEFVLDRQ
jgi:hypothetical protein